MGLDDYRRHTLDRYLKGVKRDRGVRAAEDEAERLTDAAALERWWQGLMRRVSFMDLTFRRLNRPFPANFWIGHRVA
jgi:hypothetical protein